MALRQRLDGGGRLYRQRSHGNASERGAEVTVDVAGKGPQARAGARRCVVDVGGGCTPSRSWSSFKMQMN